MMEYRDGMFQLVLGRYGIDQVREAFIEHVRRKPDLPTPSDIVNLIDPPPPVLSAAYYTSLRKRVAEGDYLLSDEREFCRAFERQEHQKVKPAAIATGSRESVVGKASWCAGGPGEP